MKSRDLKCDGYSQRSREICQSIEHSLEWEWKGHATIAPGWKVTFHTLKEVYCKEDINLSDLAGLKKLAQAGDIRLQDGASGLLALLKTNPASASSRLPESEYDAHNGAIYSTDENSVFNPANPQYILRGGCKK